MERLYTVTLKFNQAIHHPVFETKFKDYINSSGLFVPEETAMMNIASNLLATKDKGGSYIIFDWNSAHIGHNTCLEELEAVKRALIMAKKLESITPQFNPPLIFNPNLISIFVGEDSKGNYMPAEEFMPNAKEMQKRLYYGGGIAYAEYSGNFRVFLGTKNEFGALGTGKVLVESEGTAQPASSLDELLRRLEQKPQ